MKDFELSNITEEEAMDYLAKHRDYVLNEFAKAYLAETGLKPSQIELVREVRHDKIHDKMKEIEIVETFYFRERKD